MDALRALPIAGRRWYGLVMLAAGVAVVLSLWLSPLVLPWWQVLLLGLTGSLITILTAPALTDRAGRHRATTSHGVILGYLVLALAGPTTALLVNLIQYSLAQLGERLRGRGAPGHKWWFNQATTTVSIIMAWLLLYRLELPPLAATLLMPLLANVGSATIVIIMIALAGNEPLSATIRQSWRSLLWTNIDSTLITHYAGLLWLTAPWLIVTVPLLQITRGQLTRLIAQVVDQAAVEAELARRDGLTGLYNRRFLDQRLDQLQGEPLAAAILLIDIDHFKAVNDSAGHLAGDDVLKAVARCIQSRVGGQDIVGRYGGEELCVIATSAPDPLRARQLAEALRQAVADLVVTSASTPGVPLQLGVTVSIGVSLMVTADGSYAALKAADAAVYQAKRNGRNRVCLAEPATSAELAHSA